jgi:Fe2+ transport system protein FeoA
VDIEVLEKAPLGGPVTVRIGDVRHAISLELARMVTVLPETTSAAGELATA